MLPGRSKYLASQDRNLRVPPTDTNTGQRFNSVTATTGGSKIWVVYENGRAYPSYLVRYYRGFRDRSRTPLRSKPKLAYEWQFQDGPSNNGCWQPYSSEHQGTIEKAYRANLDSVVIFTLYHRYAIDFVKMTQTNISHKDRKVRNIRRQEIKNSWLQWPFENDSSASSFIIPYAILAVTIVGATIMMSRGKAVRGRRV